MSYLENPCIIQVSVIFTYYSFLCTKRCNKVTPKFPKTVSVTESPKKTIKLDLGLSEIEILVGTSADFESRINDSQEKNLL